MKASYFLIAVLAFLSYWMSVLYAPFLKDIVIAALLATATTSLHSAILKRTKRKILSSFLSTLIITLLIFVPLMYFMMSVASYINSIEIGALKEKIAAVEGFIHSVTDNFPQLKLKAQIYISELDEAEIASRLLSIGTQFGTLGAVFFKDLFIIIVFYFFSMLYGKEIIDFIGSITPLRRDDLDELYTEISSVMGVVFYSIFTVAVLEGFLFGLIVSAFGYDGLLLGILYGFSSLIPLVGGVIMWIPVAGYEALEGSMTNAIIMLVYSIVVISVIADTFVKPIIIAYINKKVVKTPASINELLIFFSIIAGLATFGFWGMILGPAITAMFIAILRLYGNLANIEESVKR